MKEIRISQDVFWMEKNGNIQIVSSTDPKIYTLEGIAAKVFLAIAKGEPIEHHDQKLMAKVISDLKSLKFIQNP